MSMYKCILFSLLMALSLQVYGQTESMMEAPEKVSLTVGVLQGGGSLIGADLELLLSDRIGVQVGAGLVGYGAGINVHVKPSLRSSFFSLMYWHQGVGDNFAQSMIGPNFVFRGKRWFTAQIGLGFALDKGPAFPSSMTQPPMMLMYSIGAYFPL